jgi:transcriptional regulator with XRE-family HTH domain
MARAAERNKSLSHAIDLAELRQALKLSQQQLAKKLRVNQPEVAKIEKRADMLLSTLSGVLRAMGAELKIVASFPDHDIQIRSLTPRVNGRQIASRRSLGSAASLGMTDKGKSRKRKTHVAG